MQLKRGQVGSPDETGDVLDYAIVHPTVVAIAPDGSGCEPLGAVLRTVFFVEEHATYAVGIALESERASREMRQEQGGDTNVIVDYLALGEAGFGVKDFIDIAEG